MQKEKQKKWLKKLKADMMKFLKGVLTPFLIIMFFSSCSKIDRVKTTIIPEKVCKKKTLKVAILPFNVKKSNSHISQLSQDQFRGEIEALIGEVENTCPSIILVSRADIKKAIQELKFSNTGYTEDVIKIGKFLKADLILTGDVGIDVSKTIFYEKIEIDDRRKNVRCERKFLAFWFYPRIINVERGQIVFTKRYEVPIEKIYCENVKVGLFKNILSGRKYVEKPPETIEMFIEAKKEALDEFKYDFTEKIENI